MLKFYCIECGNPTSYTLNKPKFCSFCGKNFTNQSSASMHVEHTVKNKIVNIRSNSINDDYDNDDVRSFDKDISKLDFEIYSEKIQPKKLKDVIGTSPKSKKDKNSIKGKRMSKLERKKVLDEFSREAGTLRTRRKDG
ncbi:MAG: hypothetical protein EBU90_08345 [Proteobacteria bacterium]|nr:hypothetical protein [Pseudomonadota bacterium]